MQRNKMQDPRTQRQMPPRRRIQKRPRKPKRKISTLMVILTHGVMDLVRERSQQLAVNKPSQT